MRARDNLVSGLPGEESLKEGVIQLGKELLEAVGLIYEVVILVWPRAGARLQMCYKGHGR